MDQNELDELFREFGWYYDNGWLHDSIRWDCYVDNNYGRSNPFFVILFKNGEGRLLKFLNDEKFEVWVGRVSDKHEVEQLIQLINSQYIENTA